MFCPFFIGLFVFFIIEFQEFFVYFETIFLKICIFFLSGFFKNPFNSISCSVKFFNLNNTYQIFNESVFGLVSKN